MADPGGVGLEVDPGAGAGDLSPCWGAMGGPQSLLGGHGMKGLVRRM